MPKEGIRCLANVSHFTVTINLRPVFNFTLKHNCIGNVCVVRGVAMHNN